SAILAGQNEGPTILATIWVLLVVPGLVMALRLYCKVMVSKSYGWDDLVICLSWTLLLVYTVLCTCSVQMGVAGRHIHTIAEPSKVPPGLELLYIGFVIVIIACVLAKTSFAITLLRIVTKAWMKVFLWFVIITMNLIMWLCAICYLLQCKPAAALWNAKLMATAECWPTHIFETIALTAGAYSGCMDFVIALFPWIIIWNLQMKRHEKLGIGIAMSLGVFAAATAFIKTSKLVNVSKVQDFTYYSSSIIIWASAETGLTILAASIPMLRILFNRFRTSYDESGPPTSGTYKVSGKFRSYHRAGPSGVYDPNPYISNSGAIAMTDWRDNSSQNSILGAEEIKQTQEVSLTYEKRTDNERETGNIFSSRRHV
ncbi:hypothetical protein N7474_000245, partial [Penicillium riverlandense]|uniref:uncharacterized protein n=1 Tax=Penicillium riverlandense TaxID=1903569 RepID=UPI002549529D